MHVLHWPEKEAKTAKSSNQDEKGINCTADVKIAKGAMMGNTVRVVTMPTLAENIGGRVLKSVPGVFRNKRDNLVRGKRPIRIGQQAPEYIFIFRAKNNAADFHEQLRGHSQNNLPWSASTQGWKLDLAALSGSSHSNILKLHPLSRNLLLWSASPGMRSVI